MKSKRIFTIISQKKVPKTQLIDKWELYVNLHFHIAYTNKNFACVVASKTTIDMQTNSLHKIL